MEASRASVLGFLRRRAMVLALCSASFVSLLWFLYWIGYDVIVWSKPLVAVNLFNYAGAVLSLAVILAGLRLRAKRMVDASNTGQNEEVTNTEGQAGVLEQSDVEKRVDAVEQSSEEEESSPVLRELEEEESSLVQEKQDLLVLKERLELETREKVEARKRSVDALKSEVADLKRQVEELTRRLKNME